MQSLNNITLFTLFSNFITEEVGGLGDWKGLFMRRDIRSRRNLIRPVYKIEAYALSKILGVRQIMSMVIKY